MLDFAGFDALSKADIYAPLRSGSDIAFFGGMIKYILDNDFYNKEYAVEYTNASLIKGIKNGERVNVSSARAALECTAVVTKRLRPFKLGYATVHQVGIPWHFGWRWPASGTEDSANLLTPPAGDPNTRIPETKAFMVDVAKL